MSDKDVSLDHIVPQICLRCGAWFGADPRIRANYKCSACGSNNRQFEEFYALCAKLEKDFGSILNEDTREQALSFALPSGLGVDTLALISAFAVGILTNASYDIVKTWIRSRAHEFRKKYRATYDYNQAVEVLFDYIIDHVDSIQKLKTSGSSISVVFEDSVGELRERIEGSVARVSRDDAKPGQLGAQAES
ncbi:hypothetical protein KAW44_08300 [Candidatus Bipolaricaulota bacterium]|nr:hypothetical protein [Candidatus Bipolaricaulota bacterium]